MTPPPYSGPSPRCIKCGNLGAYTRHRTDMTGERLARECDRCAYEWAEATVEQQPSSHLGGNAEDCPACAGTNPDYPSICPGPTQEPAA